MRPAHAAAVLVLLLPALRAAAAAEPGPIPLPEGEPYVHAPSGFRFPPDVGTFTRVTAFRYDDRGENVSVGYNDFALRVIFTVYVYPDSNRPLAAHFEQVKREVAQAHPDAQLLESGDWELKQGERTFTGRRAAFGFKVKIAGRDHDVVSEAFLIRHGDRLIKYRVTCPKDKHEAAADRVQNLIQSLTLPEEKAPVKK
jgi:radical SAM superfamily enzyme with C-terminal helix-hairpin-helix motif